MIYVIKKEGTVIVQPKTILKHRCTEKPQSKNEMLASQNSF